ncbi:MAG: ATP-grasp domain-containing protein [Candidatus Thorarchaeota archaeon]|nr:ATP-grasp domain-containing protein [Candidatus Thorarchaeota archaeon]
MRIGLVLNTRKGHSEFEVEYDPPHTIELIRHGIEATGHEYVFIEADENLAERLKAARPDLVFNRAEGIRGDSRESHAPAILEMLGIPYVGGNVLTTAVGLNKAWTKKILAYHGILSAQFQVLKAVRDADAAVFKYPVILKPNEEGSSVGINEDNVVHNKEQLKKKLAEMLKDYQQGILVEQFIEGREFSVGVLGTSNGGFEVLPILEIDFSQLPPEVGGVFGQRAKTIYDSLDNYICPAKIPASLRKALGDLAVRIAEILGSVDFGRIDFRMDDKGDIYFLEINPLPGMDLDMENRDFSFYPFMAMKAGYSYDELIRRLLESACHRYGLKL